MKVLKHFLRLWHPNDWKKVLIWPHLTSQWRHSVGPEGSCRDRVIARHAQLCMHWLPFFSSRVVPGTDRSWPIIIWWTKGTKFLASETMKPWIRRRENGANRRTPEDSFLNSRELCAGSFLLGNWANEPHRHWLIAPAVPFKLVRFLRIWSFHWQWVEARVTQG